MADTNATDDPDVERYFNDGTDRYDEDLYHAAKRIAAGQALTVAELDAVKSKVNKRSGDDISLLPLALWKKNAAAFDQLLSIGADPTLPLKLTGEHVYDSVLMGIAQGSEPIATEFPRLYLKHGGSPNARMGVNQDPLVEFAATMENFESYKLRLDHGADVWKLSGPTRWSESGPLRATDVNPSSPTISTTISTEDNALETAALIGSRNGDYKFVDYAANTRLVHEASTSPKLELHVTCDHYMTPTAALSDYVFPIASKTLEQPLMANGEDAFLHWALGEQIVKPLGERKGDYDFWRGLATRFGLEEYFPWETKEEFINYRLAPIGLTLDEAMRPPYNGVLMPNWRPKMYAEIYPNTGKLRGFSTISGRCEIWNVALEECGYEPLPDYQEPAESPLSTPLVYKKYPLILNTGGRFRPMFHSEGRHLGMGFREQHPWPVVDIHESVAREHLIGNGDWVWIETRRGKILQKARVSETIHPKVINAESSWWYPEMPEKDPSLLGAFISNTNLLTLDDEEALDEYQGAWQNRALLCKIYKAKSEDVPIQLRT